MSFKDLFQIILTLASLAKFMDSQELKSLYILSNFDELNVEINENIRNKFIDGYDHNKLCLHWYNIFKNLSDIEES